MGIQFACRFEVLFEIRRGISFIIHFCFLKHVSLDEYGIVTALMNRPMTTKGIQRKQEAGCLSLILAHHLKIATLTRPCTKRAFSTCNTDMFFFWFGQKLIYVCAFSI